jgi:hypothetical protein
MAENVSFDEEDALKPVAIESSLVVTQGIHIKLEDKEFECDIQFSESHEQRL